LPVAVLAVPVPFFTSYEVSRLLGDIIEFGWRVVNSAAMHARLNLSHLHLRRPDRNSKSNCR